MRADLLRAILGEVTGQSPTALEIAETLWLAGHAGEGHRGPDPVAVEPAAADPFEGPAVTATGNEAETAASLSELQAMPAPADPEPATVPAMEDPALSLHVDADGQDFEASTGTFETVAVPSAETLHDRLGLQRALRPLKRRVPSPHVRVLDEIVTAERIADELMRSRPEGPGRGLSLRPAEERWLRLDIVFDAGPSMAMWRDHVVELERLMNQVGAFSAVRCWSLEVAAGVATLRTFGTRAGGRAPGAILGVEGRQAILVVSDCSGANWWRGTLPGVVAGWARRAPVAIIQPLPERLWARTAAPARPGSIKVAEPGLPNSRLRFTPSADFAGPVRGGVPVPVLELSASWFGGWASTVAGVSSAAFPCAVAHLQGSGARAVPASLHADLTAEDRVLRFRSSASPDAFRLAGFIATTVPTVPVMRLVQQAMFGRSSPAQLAEVILSGLFRTDYSGAQRFTFFDGVRELMLSTLTKVDALSAVRVLQGVSQLIESRAGETDVSFPALLGLPPGQGAGADRGGASFALVSPEALARLAPAALTRTSSGPATTPMPEPERRPRYAPLPAWIQVRRVTSSMLVRQPMLFVGLGGTGCRVGAEFERRLREALCGSDGMALQERLLDEERLPYQLPRCTQFVYADLSASELARVRRTVVPGPEHEQAAQMTMGLVEDLVPAGLNNSSEVAQSLRIHLDDDMIGWLPPRDTDPRIGPLVRGAGQLPTVARSALFETLRRDADAATSAIRTALSEINKSAGDLRELSGGLPRHRTVLVFVAFSVTGGVGSGLFYDYLHLIGDLFVRGGLSAEIYPLVLMPSAFDEGQGGGRAVELNAGSALIDLFRLIDDQNAMGSVDDLDVSRRQSSVAVRHPRSGLIRLPPNMIQTALLFGRSAPGILREDLHESMTSLMTSFMSAAPPGEWPDAAAADAHLSFADSFINGAVERSSVADAGFGRRGVTTSAVATVATPLAEITDVIAGRLLARAVEELLVPPGALENNKSYIRAFISVAGLDAMLEARPRPVAFRGSDAVGHQAVLNALVGRADDMAANVRDKGVLAPAVAGMAQGVRFEAATARVLRDIDLFRACRVAVGHAELTDPIDRGGFSGLLDSWSQTPAPPAGLDSELPPKPGVLPRKLLSRVRMADPEVREVIQRQDSWYAWQTRRLYNACWNDSRRLWERPWRSYIDELSALVQGFHQHVSEDRQSFEVRSRELYRSRPGAAYILPPENRGLEGLYRAVVDRMQAEYSASLPSNAHEGHVLNALLGPDNWQRAYEAGRRDPMGAVGFVRQRVREAVAAHLHPPGHDRVALVPRMEDLLRAAATEHNRFVPDQYHVQLREKLADLVPRGLVPAGRAPVRALITYPSLVPSEPIEHYLHREVALRIDPEAVVEFRAVPGESVTVIMNRTGMGVTDVPEVRRLLKVWSDAHRRPEPHDYLAWRRRLEPDVGYRLLARDDRPRVLHHLLCAAWNGAVTVGGDVTSPTEIVVSSGGRDSISMRLDLSSFGTLSSWGNLLQAYESWTVTDDDPARGELAARLMWIEPKGVDHSLQPPSPVYTAIVEQAEREVGRIEEAAASRALSRDPQLVVLGEFWRELLPAALAMPIGVDRRRLTDLQAQFNVAGGPGE
ncbi:hypothetical protein JIG36_13070 [Actinoplanes sp. LDG1-06]|uniref:Uncharacterized protein n=1 Tax=Paractinoplanes ovalisporus TaxID=2810368 RepID=A0ABS2A9I0_9ACTN|nr:SAV_2336 N-terminal domain-related protein [Actinoplanes ovalisporus]MBM2616488.1 hypothetical protein [Actinoplanes ovalisporus]